ncbi:MAG: heme lyase CcmF/NrfE family subunit [Phyllobacteriaceae bacterium]|nr:heme lyase CcmF/NrfE family subunit [Phyllobacteriaceae bacterium]
MINELGHFALVLAFALSLVQSVVPLAGARLGNQKLMAVGSSVSTGMFVFTLLAFASLTSAYVTSDFSLENVWANSHSAKPMLYKVTGVWGNHEGSMLLWVLILAFFGALVAWFGSNIPAQLKANVLAVQGWIAAAFFLFILLTSNPFARLSPAPFEGNDLNPVLQDIGLAIHPPMLYLGYVGFSVTFSFAVAAMISGRIDAAWARWVRPWALTAWLFLTAGIAMGSYWAYYELGWGGWWFWDPVENASFIPWLVGTALLHSALVMEKREALKIWTILLAIITFSMSLLGTFLVRSGVLTSVHAFANDPERGVFILMILMLFIGGSLTLFAVRAPLLKAGGLFQPISREGALVFNNVFLTTAAATVLVGTLYPLVVEALSGAKISVGAPFFNITFGPLMIPLLMLVPIGPLLSWKRADLYPALQRLFWVAGLALLAVIVTLALTSGEPVLASLGIGLAVWVMIGSLAEIWTRAGIGKASAASTFSRLTGLPRSMWGTALGHFGLGVILLGVVTVSVFEQESVAEVAPGETIGIAGYEIAFQGMTPVTGPNYTETVANLSVTNPSGGVFALKPAKRVYQARGMPTTEAAIRTIGFSQLYISLGDVSADGKLVIRAWWKPLVTLIWIGAIFMVAGGMISLTDRRLRVGIARRARRTVAGKQADALS